MHTKFSNVSQPAVQPRQSNQLHTRPPWSGACTALPTLWFPPCCCISMVKSRKVQNWKKLSHILICSVHWLVQAVTAHCCIFLRAILLVWFVVQIENIMPDCDCIFYCWYRQQIRIQQLSDENSSLQERLKTADDTIERQMKQIENLTLQLGEAERTLAEKEEDMESLDKASKDEVYKHWFCNFCRNLNNFYLKRACCIHGRNTSLSLKALVTLMHVCVFLQHRV